MSAHNHSEGQSGHGDSGHYVAPLSMYLGTFAALLVLTVITVAVTYVDLGRFNIVVAMAIAVVKAGLVSLFFMGLIHDSDRFNGMVFTGALIFLSLFFLFTFPDLLFRSALDPIKGNPGTNPAAFNYKLPETPQGLDLNGHADPAMNPKRLYGANGATGASPSTSGVLILESAGAYLPGGADYGREVPGEHVDEH